MKSMEARPQPAGRKAVILGASGFIGINLARRFATSGQEFVCFSRSRSLHWPERCTTIQGDLSRPPAALIEAMEGADIFHLVSTTRPTNSTMAAADELIDNTAATVRLLEATKDLECRWVFASSGGTVYGQTDVERIPEDHPTRPISSYGVAKLAIERYLHLFRTLHGTDYVVARISNPYGPFQSPKTGQGLVATLFDRISRGVPVEIWGDGENVRDYLYVEDVAEALIATATSGVSGEVYNIGSGTGTSVLELVAVVARELRCQPHIVHQPARGIDVRRNVLDITLAKRVLGWRPSTEIAKGIASTSSHFERNF